MSKSTTIRLTCALSGLMLLLSSTGCGTGGGSFRFPWQKQKSKKQPRCTSDRDDQQTDEQIREAKNWAMKAVAASQQLAQAHGIRAAVENKSKAYLAQSEQETTSTDPDAKSAASQPTDKTTEPDARTNDSAEASSQSTPPEYRRVRRRAGKGNSADPSDWPLSLPEGKVEKSGRYAQIDPSRDSKVYRLVEKKARKKIREKYGFRPPKTTDAIAIPGKYLAAQKFEEFDDLEHLDQEARTRQIAVVEPGKRIEIFAGETQIASLDLPSASKIPDSLEAIRPVRVIKDDTTQLLVYWAEPAGPDRESSEEKKKKKRQTGNDAEYQQVEYKAALLKVIGPFVGKAFEETVAVKTSADAKIRRTGYFEILRGAKNRFIRWTPADEQGEPDTSSSKILKWNPWSGVFRVPKPPPTAPDQRS